jgi:DUF971 family protein
MQASPAAFGPVPVGLVVHAVSCVLELAYEDGSSFRLPCELLRVYSPSAEVQGHGPGQEVLQTGKRGVGIVAVEPVGHYGIKPIFSDGHESGIFAWAYLHDLAVHQDARWDAYLARLRVAGLDRDAPMTQGAAGGGCSSHG